MKSQLRVSRCYNTLRAVHDNILQPSINYYQVWPIMPSSSNSSNSSNSSKNGQVQGGPTARMNEASAALREEIERKDVRARVTRVA